MTDTDESAQDAAATETQPCKASGAPAPWTLRRTLRLLEFVGLFFGIPAIYTAGLVELPMILFLIILTVGCVLILLIDRTFQSRLLWNAAPVRTGMKNVVLAFLPLAVLMLLFTLVLHRDWLFRFPRQAPLFWMIVMILYPIFSVYPQELVCRVFFFHRYEQVFGRGGALILASAIAFAFMHIVLENWIAVSFTFVGGLLFSITYARTRSLLLVTIEHALYGCWIFTIGLGTYFYGGAVDRSRDEQSPTSETSHTMSPEPEEETPAGESEYLQVGLRQ